MKNKIKDFIFDCAQWIVHRTFELVIVVIAVIAIGFVYALPEMIVNLFS